MVYVVIRSITGGELFERVIDEDFVLTERACTVFMRQICEGIEFVHRQNILHLDMKVFTCYSAPVRPFHSHNRSQEASGVLQ